MDFYTILYLLSFAPIRQHQHVQTKTVDLRGLMEFLTENRNISNKNYQGDLAQCTIFLIHDDKIRKLFFAGSLYLDAEIKYF